MCNQCLEYIREILKIYIIKILLKNFATWFIAFKKENEKSALISVGLFMILCIIVIVLFFSSLLSSEWRFPADVYGTVSDWVMVIVTLFSAVFIYKTLDSQMTVQNEQTRLFKIEEQKYLREIKPSINYSLESISGINFRGVFFKIIVFSDKETNISVKTIFQRGHTGANLFIAGGDKQNQAESKFAILNDGLEKFDSFVLELTYTDSDGNEYILKDLVNFRHLPSDGKLIYSVVNQEKKLLKTIY